MKNITYTLLFISSILWAQSEKQSIDMQRGSGRDCFGAKANCTFRVSSDETNKSAAKYRAYAVDAKTLVLEINIAQLSDKEESELVTKSLDAKTNKTETFYIMDEYFVMDNESLQLLGISLEYNTIDIGKYPIYQKDDKLTVLIPLVRFEDVK